jgi:hypothetical protein
VDGILVDKVLLFEVEKLVEKLVVKTWVDSCEVRLQHGTYTFNIAFMRRVLSWVYHIPSGYIQSTVSPSILGVPSAAPSSCDTLQG